MKPRITVACVMVLIALLGSAVPAATLTVRPAQAASVCDWAQFVADTTVPDGTNVLPGLTFTKTWRLKNIGTCTWTTSYTLVFSSGSQLGGSSSVSFPNIVAPGQSVDISVSLTAPTAPGHYVGFWQFKNAAGTLFGIGSTTRKPWWVDINVLAPDTFDVAYDFASNSCSATWYSTEGSLPCPGADGDSRGFVLKVDAPQLENGTVSTGSGLILMPQAIFNGDIHGTFPAFHVQSGDRFRSIVNCAYGATSCFVTFRLDYQIGTGPINTLWSLREKSDGGFFRTDLGLSALAGQDVKFILTVLATGSADGDRALWVDPVIVRTGITPTPTGTPGPATPTPTPFPAPSCDRAQFISDVTVPDGTIYTPGTTFAKTWRLKNVGTCTWTTAFSLVFDSGEQMGGPASVAMPGNVVPGATVDISVNLTAPNAAGTFRGYWKFQDANGARFGIGTGGTKAWWVEIKVSGATATPTPYSVTGTPTPTATPSTGTPTPLPANCDRAQFISDVTVPDGTVFAPGVAFTKTWRLKNVGTCTWTTSYAMVFDTGARMGGPDSVSMPQTVPPGSSVDVSVVLTAPGTAGSYRGYWRFQNAAGVRFGLGTGGTRSWWVDIRVSGTSATPTPTPTAAGTDTSGWNVYSNSVYGFSFKIPPGSSIVDQSDNSGRVNLPFTSGTLLSGKWIDVTVVEGADPCRSPNAGLVSSSENVTINGLQFLKELGGEGTAGHFYDITSYSTRKDNACISLTFVLQSMDPGVFATPPPPYDKAAESAVFPIIMSTFGLSGTPATGTSTPTPTPTSTSTPTPTATSLTTAGWSTFQNLKYGFSFQFPPGSMIVSQSESGGRVFLPFTAGTNLLQKYLDVNVAEGVNPCTSPGSNPTRPSETVTFNGIQFLKQAWEDGATSHRGDWVAYSTQKGNACISMSFYFGPSCRK